VSLKDDIDTIHAYTQWKAQQQDTSPEAFVEWRAKSAAYDRLTEAVAYFDGIYMEAESVGIFDMNTTDVCAIYKILGGERKTDDD